jgi:hypothetical protein
MSLLRTIKSYLKFYILYSKFISSYLGYRRVEKGITKKRFSLQWKDRWPCLYDNLPSTNFDRHYVYHPAWAARIVRRNNPPLHIDISSSLHFCTMLSAFIPVEFYDYRPANVVLSYLTSHRSDLNQLQFPSDSVISLSCMHTVEHIGLGRYGDAIDYNGDLKAMSELARVLAPKGHLLFVVPVGAQSKIQYNAHRVYHPEQVISAFKDLGLDLVEFSMIPESEDDGGLVTNPSSELLQKQSYACGCFWFTKKEI